MKKYFLLLLLSFSFNIFTSNNVYSFDTDSFGLEREQLRREKLEYYRNQNMMMREQQYQNRRQIVQPRNYTEKELQQLKKQRIEVNKKEMEFFSIQGKINSLTLRKMWLGCENKDERIALATAWAKDNNMYNAPYTVGLSESKKRQLFYETVEELVIAAKVVDTPEINAKFREASPQIYDIFEERIRQNNAKKKKKK